MVVSWDGDSKNGLEEFLYANEIKIVFLGLFQKVLESRIGVDRVNDFLKNGR